MVEVAEKNDIEQIEMDPNRDRYPFCIVWTPIPMLTWIFPIIGHMGIGLSNGIIRDFAGSYYVSEDDMAFGKPTKYWQLNPSLAKGGVSGFDEAVIEASEIYKCRTHNLILDNCHSHVATALNLMQYRDSSRWNMVKLAILMLVYSKYVSFSGFLKTWMPFGVFVLLIGLLLGFA